MKVEIDELIKIMFGVLLFITFFIPQITAQEINNKNMSSVANDLGFYVLPSNDQPIDQQRQDELDCYQWAVERSGYDPLNSVEVKDQNTEAMMERIPIPGNISNAAVDPITSIKTTKEVRVSGVSGEDLSSRNVQSNEEIKQEAYDESADMKNQQKLYDESAEIEKKQQLVDSFNEAFSGCLEGKKYNIAK